MQVTNKNSEIIIYLVTVSYIMYKIMYEPSVPYITAFILIAGLHYLLTNNIISSLLIALIFCIVWQMIYPKKNNLLESMKIAEIENFEDAVKDEDKSKNDKEVKDEVYNEEGNTEEVTGQEFTDGEGATEPYLDVGRSFLEAYKNLSPKQIEGLTFDTKELLTTQQKLIETLNNIGPTLKEGRQILDTFKDYFVNE